jgi:hypothetical protein
MRDLMFVVRVCDGTPPIANDISNITGVAASGPSSVAVCQGQAFCVDMVVTDANPATVINMRSNAATLLPGSTFVVTGTNPAVGRLCWTANLALLPANVYIESGDGECPIENVASRSIYVNSCLLLPVELVSFDATDQGAMVGLDWSTSMETGTDRFVVERSADGIVFRAIGQVDAMNGTGIHRYEWSDQTPLEGVNYYRLMTVDHDGSVDFSETVVVDRSLPAPIRATNLAPGRWSVTGLHVDEVWNVFDLLGRDVDATWTSSGSIELRTHAADPCMILFTVVRGMERKVLKLPGLSSAGDVLVATP